ncbi:hypothetical protein LSH36_9g00002 [Paralvinella palmiformis]|uniref:G-protein coupled receptors family 1 profile domain-containing protein n=1 Tax=Paralvinella palmiformis TaxID=53620 RepID=A0AAD9NJI3_9ANNE|nr:hypothetical protein LSH36_9g00002 [Paralvinella palmiformis]
MHLNASAFLRENETNITEYLLGNVTYPLDRRQLDGSSCQETTKFILNTIFAGILSCLGFIGNSVSYAVLAKDKEAPVAAYLLQTLALFDNFFLSTWFLHFSLADSFTYVGILDQFHVTWLYIRVYSYPLLFVAQTCTIWMVVLIAISRYVAVCKPYRAVRYSSLRNVRRAVLGVVLFATVYNVPRFFETKLVQIVVGGRNSTRYRLERTTFGNSRTYGLLYFDSLYYIFSFILPLILLTFLNTKLTLAYRRVQRRRQQFRLRQENYDHDITLVMIVVILVFILCNAPARIVQIIWGYRLQKCLTVEFLLIEISNVLEVLNSSVNFVVYCVFRSQFRFILQTRLCSATRRQTPAVVVAGLEPNGRRESCITNHVTVCTGITMTSDIPAEQEQEF